MIQSMDVKNRETPIVEVQLQGVPDFTDVFNDPENTEMDYCGLHEMRGRSCRETAWHDPELSSWLGEFHAVVETVTDRLLSLETTRYPVKGDRRQWLRDKTKIYVVPVEDCAGFCMPWHLDHRLVIAAGSVNLEDNTETTIFQRDDTGWRDGRFQGNELALTHRARGTTHTATFWLNTEQTWHAVETVQDRRRTLLITVTVE